MTEPVNYIRLDAGYDKNGNSRRICVLLDKEAHIIDVLEEGPTGEAVVQVKYPQLAGMCGPKFTTTPAMYREVLKDWKGRKCWS